MIQEALRGVVRKVLRRTQDFGMPPEHLFYITFKTMAQQVVLPLYLRRKYPESMTIVLQHQFHNLQVGEKGFSVSLGFSGKFENLCIPFSAIEMFSDPTAELVLSFQEKAEEKLEGNSAENSAKNSAKNSGSKTLDIIATSNSKNNSNGSNSNEIKNYSASYSGVEAASNFSSDLNWLSPISYGFEKKPPHQTPSSASKGDHLKQIATKEIRPSAKVLKFRTKSPSGSPDSIGSATKKKVTRKTSRETLPPENNRQKNPQEKLQAKPQVKSSPNKPEDANNDSPSP